MMNSAAIYSWDFGGPLAGVASTTAWNVLAVALGVCLLLSWLSYRYAAKSINRLPRALLIALRTACFAALLLYLAGPVRIESITVQPPAVPPPPVESRRLAVVVDRSESMTKPDNRGKSRLDHALVTWRKLEPSLQSIFPQTTYYSFANDLRPADTLAAALARTGDTGETKLYRSLASLLEGPPDTRPQAMIVLTDGVDTSGDSPSQLRERALGAGVPVYFISGFNRERSEPFLRVREWRAPATARHNTVVPIDATFEAFSLSDRTVPYTLTLDNQLLKAGSLSLTTGYNLVPLSFPFATGESGTRELRLQLGAGPKTSLAARSVTRVLGEQPLRIIIIQGALDWSFRYLSAALRTDTNFQYVLSMDPSLFALPNRTVAPGGAVFRRLPDDPNKLASVDCIVLAYPSPKNLSVSQQKALGEFVRTGGSLLFFGLDDLASFAGQPLTELLPVSAESAQPNRNSRTEAASEVEKLSSFGLTDAGRLSPIFAQAGTGTTLLPQFFKFTPLHRAKPGAEILAVHPSSRDRATGQPHILLATQTYGRGRTTLLTTDALWRWKLHEPSKSRAVETFWQQLLLSIGRRVPREPLQFVTMPAQLKLDQMVQLRLISSADQRPTITAKSPSGRITTLVVTPNRDKSANWSAEWKPDEPGAWEITAVADGDERAYLFPSARAGITGELAGTPPALESMRTLAGETGGQLLTQELPAEWRGEKKKETLLPAVVSERRHWLWHTPYCLWAALGLFSLELILRRCWRLL